MSDGGGNAAAVAAQTRRRTTTPPSRSSGNATMSNQQQPYPQQPYVQQQPLQTQDIIKQLSDIFGPQFKEIKEQLHDLVTRREHDKDLADVSADIAAQRRDFDRLQQWADVRPRKSADADWVQRIESDVRTLETQLAARPGETRATLNTIFSGGGCLYMVIALVVMIVFQLITIGVSIGLTLALR